MDEQYNHNDLERFLKQNTDAHRLYPSDRVWTRLYSRLHNRRRHIGALLLLLPLLIGSGWMLWPQTESAEASTPLAALKNPSLKKDKMVAGAVRSPLVRSADPIRYSYNPPVLSFKTLTPDPQRQSFTKEETTVAKELPTPSPAIDIAPAENPNTEMLQVQEDTPIAAEQTQGDAKEESLDNENLEAPGIENVTNSYKRQLHRPRFTWKMHFTPTISYRTLQEDQKFIAQARMSSAAAQSSPALSSSNPTDLASVVRHRPDLGLQFGFTGTYPLSKKLDWVTGVQFNVSKYDIEAYSYPSEVATIAVMNPWGGTSTVSTLTSFRSNGFRSSANWLRNYYYSVSMPIGLQWRILGKRQTHWGISATAQPTYVVGNRSYVISVDYQNYAEVPYLINKWNLNVGLETYARFQLGKNDFQIGPQIRYQALSSFKKGFPVQEHLYDFGIKLGMSLGK